MENYLVSKENKLIEASYKLTVGEQKIVLYYASKINPKVDTEFITLKMKILDFAELLGIENNKDVYDRIKKASRNLMSKVITIHEDDGDLLVNWFSSVKYHDGDGMVSLQSDPRLTPYLLNLKQYTQYKLGNIIKLNSAHSIRIYEILKQYEKIGKRILGIQELKEMIGLSPNQYSRFYDFKTKVILNAQNELKEKTDISFDFEEIKTGRKITSIKFYIKSNKTKKRSEFNANDEVAVTVADDLKAEENITNHDLELLEQLLEYGISFKEAKKILQDYSAEQIQNNIDYAIDDHTRENKSNFAGFLIKAIKENYAGNKPQQVKIQSKTKMDLDHDYDIDLLERKLLKNRKPN